MLIPLRARLRSCVPFPESGLGRSYVRYSVKVAHGTRTARRSRPWAFRWALILAVPCPPMGPRLALGRAVPHGVKCGKPDALQHVSALAQTRKSGQGLARVDGRG